ncbi:MAG TPA: hypothetical protein VJ934_00975 [Desulfomicrobiaceae bacterium]|nr:hypothetical protein [Desulfomicrobiaceae bacterium]
MISFFFSSALLPGRYGFRTDSGWYGVTLKIMAAALACFALFFIRDGITMLTAISG